jgi:hypothetical protein
MSDPSLTRPQRIGVVAAGVIAVVGAIVLVAFGSHGNSPLDIGFGVITGISQLAWWAVGATIVVRTGGHRVGRLMVLEAGLGAILFGAFALTGGDPAVAVKSSVGPWATLVMSATYGPWFVTVILASMLLFPDGRLPGSRWRLPVATAGVLVLVSTLAWVVHPGPFGNGMPINPVGLSFLPAEPLEALFVLDPLGIAMLGLMGAAGVVARFRRGSPDVRRQLKWLLVAVIPAAVFTPVSFFEPDKSGTSLADLLSVGALLLLAPVAIGIAVTRYRLYDIDRIISRTVSYGAVTGILAVVFVGTILVSQTVLASFFSGNSIAVAASTLVVAALFQPLRWRVQSVVDRRFNRARYDAERTVAAFGAHLRDEVDLGRVSEGLLVAVHSTVRPEAASVWLRRRPA